MHGWKYRHLTSYFLFQIVSVLWKRGRQLSSRGKLPGSNRYATEQTYNKLAHSPEPYREDNSSRTKTSEDDITVLHQKNSNRKLLCSLELLFAQGSWQLGYKLCIYSNLLKLAYKIKDGNSYTLLLFRIPGCSSALEDCDIWFFYAACITQAERWYRGITGIKASLWSPNTALAHHGGQFISYASKATQMGVLIKHHVQQVSYQYRITRNGCV